MTEHRLVEVVCPVCGSAKSRWLFDVRDYAFHCTDDTFAVRQCIECGCGYVSPRPLEQDMQIYYPKSYYWSWEGAFHELSWDEIIEKRRVQLRHKARWLSSQSPGKLLDIGAQKGEFIWYMRQLGWYAEGVEWDSSVPNPASMPIRYGDFLTMEFEPGSYDCITLWAVLEHVYHPSKFIERAAALLRPGGKLVALVTNLNSIQARFLRQDDYPRHLTIFTPSTVRRLCARHELRVTRIQTGQEIFGGTLHGVLVYAAKCLSGYSQDEALGEWKQTQDSTLFWKKWRGRRSLVIQGIRLIDRALTYPLEKLLDALGFGFILTFSAEKVVRQASGISE